MINSTLLQLCATQCHSCLQPSTRLWVPHWRRVSIKLSDPSQFPLTWLSSCSPLSWSTPCPWDPLHSGQSAQTPRLPCWLPTPPVTTHHHYHYHHHYHVTWGPTAMLLILPRPGDHEEPWPTLPWPVPSLYRTCTQGCLIVWTSQPIFFCVKHWPSYPGWQPMHLLLCQ